MSINIDLLAKARLNAKRTMGYPCHKLPVAALACDLCNLQVDTTVALVGLSWRSGWLHVCDDCARGAVVLSSDWMVVSREYGANASVQVPLDGPH